jgi:hypothetical protein
MHPMYRRLRTNEKSHLWQGDIIDSEKLGKTGALAGHQDYLAARKDLPAFCVVTQTCDLMPNRHVDFITLALVRHLKNIFSDKDVVGDKNKNRTHNLLDKIINHRENKGYFYLHPHPPLIDDWGAVVDLRAAFALHKQHYHQILLARRTSLAEVFANKLGWMAGHLFNRVPNIEFDEFTTDGAGKQFVGKMLEAIKATKSHALEIPLFSFESHVAHLTPRRISHLPHARREKMAEQLAILLRRLERHKPRTPAHRDKSSDGEGALSPGV